MTQAELQAKVDSLQAENDALKAKALKAATISFKVSPKGALSIYGLGRFPVTLYRGQWERLVEVAPKITDFIAENASALAVKE